MAKDQGGGGNSPGNSLGDRIAAARKRQGLDRPAPGSSDGASSPWGIGLRVGVELVSALMVGLAIGWGLDRWLGTAPWLLIVFVMAGGAAGVLNVYRLFSPSRAVERGLGERRRD